MTAALLQAGEKKSLCGLVMIVDDEPVNIAVVRKYLADAGCRTVIAVTNATEVREAAKSNLPDVILLDINMPEMSGIEVLNQLQSTAATARIPVLILTANTDHATRAEALEHGATDFLAKPVDPHELLPRLRNTLASKRYQDHLRTHAEQLELEVRRRTDEINRTRIEVVHCLARAAEFRDNETGRHVLRVGRYAAIISTALKYNPQQIELIELAAALHDVGKIGIPDQILLKPGKLTEEEFAIMQRHTTRGARVFEAMGNDDTQLIRKHTDIGGAIFGQPQFDLLQLAKLIALTHHERFDGTGYPLGLAGQDIPMLGRIVAVADVFDALSSKRPYKPAFPRERCFEILREGSGKHFDPVVLEAFYKSADQIVQTQIDLADSE